MIDPLFLDDLKEQLNQIKQLRTENALKRRAKEFQEKLASLKFLDPACGSGNFLTETYLSLRKLENEAIKLQITDNNVLLDTDQKLVKVSIQQFYGIEINDFAVSVAKTALWIAESQMLEETKSIVYANWDFLPLKTYTHIHEGNALRMDWNDVLPSNECNYIMGNPPFIGKKEQTKEQKQELKEVFNNSKVGNLDYVSGWYKKADNYVGLYDIKIGFVSTNSISQGEQVSLLWNNIANLKIYFAVRSFVWDSEAAQKAHVHVVVIGMYNKKIPVSKKTIFDGNLTIVSNNINPYLVTYIPDDVYCKSRAKNIDNNAPKMIYGSMPIDGGNLILDEDDVNEIAKEDQRYLKFVREYCGGNELINNKKRWCLWLEGANPTEYRNSRFITSRINLTRKFREKSGRLQTKKLADVPYLFGEIRQPKTTTLVFPKVSSEKRRYIPIPFVKSEVIINGSSLMIPDATNYEFGILESNMHMSWMRMVAGRMKSDYQYSKELVYNNFPWPTPTEEQKKKIAETAQGILDARALYPNSSLADLYDELTMPVELRKAHQANDRAVMAAYGLPIKGTTESDAVAKLFDMYEKLVSTSK
nr:DNA methyltransferase [Lactobacillus delbrueckii]